MTAAAKLLLAAVLAMGVAMPAQAAAVTYRGTIGGQAVGVEITDATEDALVGRFFWTMHGVDIPLQPRPGAGGTIVLAEEGACGPALCARDPENYDIVTRVPIVATWSLVLSPDGARLNGTRQDMRTAEVAAIALERVGHRTLPPNVTIDPFTLHDVRTGEAPRYSDGMVAGELYYDTLKLDVALMEGPVVIIDGSSVTYVTDPRTQFAFPRILSLADGSDPGPANRVLARLHGRMSLEALDCMSAIHMGFGWDDRDEQAWGTLGYYDAEEMLVTYLSPRVMSWNQSGTLYCDGVEGYEHSDSYNLDVRAGTQLDLTRVLAGVTARRYSDPSTVVDPALVQLTPGDPHWHFDAEIIDWLLANLEPLANPPENTNCVTSELIDGHVGVHFEAEDVIVFALERLPHFTSMCARTLASTPVTALPAQFTVPGSDYFDN